METKKTKVYNLIILDKSGSMLDVRKAAVDGYNETIGSIKAAQLKYFDTQEHFISLAVFCGCGVEMVYDCTPIKDAEKLTKEQYAPCCMTPLYDAIGQSVQRIAKVADAEDDAAVLVTIITDGMENASKEWTGPAIKKLIDERKEEGWMFSYIGADHDVESVAANISITNVVVWEKSEVGTEDMFHHENNARGGFFAKMHKRFNAFLSAEEKKAMRKQFSQEYYDEDEF